VLLSVDDAREILSGEVVDWVRSKSLLPSTVHVADALYDGGKFTTPVSCKELLGLKYCCPTLAVDDEW
jgi:ribosomal protein S19